jgi:hypothetical protein
MVAKTRLSAARPDRGERIENAARRSRVKKSIEKAQQEEAFKEMVKIIGNNGGKMPYGEVDKLVKNYNKNGFKAVTRQNLYYRLSKLKDGLGDELTGKTIVTSATSGVTSDITDEQILADVSNNQQDAPTNPGGRKKGTTKKAIRENAQSIDELVTKCAVLYDDKIKEAKKAGLSYVPNGTLKKIISEEEEKAGLSVNTISLDTVRSRVKRCNLTAFNKNQQSPIFQIEPIICEFCIRLGKMGRPLTKTTVIELANDLVSGTELECEIINFKKLRKLNCNQKLGDAWYRGFLSRHQDQLTRNASAVKDLKRRTWVKTENFKNMYENVYETMVEAGIAEVVEEAIQHEAGLPTKYKLTRPEYLIFVDETGCNTNQLNDGKVGGELFIMPKNVGDAAAPAGATTDIHFTVLPFISGTGEPVLCAIIFKSEQAISEIPVNWKTGINLCCDNADDMKQVAAGGPTCTYLGKEIPCFYGTSPKASITSQLLADMLKYLDMLGIFDRTIAHPFLLLDGHHSRMMLPFLQYVNDPRHKWYSCFGVPYATHVWQVADASSLNGAYKVELTKAKRKYIEMRELPKFEPTDIVPLVNMAFPNSFGSRKNAIKAIADRGWNPLNYNILTSLPLEKDVVDLTVASESEAVIHIPRLNIENGVGSYYIDRLIEEEKKSMGRKNKFENLKSEQRTKQQKIEHIKKLTKVSSAVLAANNHYTLDETVLEMVIDKHNEEEAAKKAIEERKKAADLKRAETLKKALEKFALCPNGLTVPDLKVLVTAATNTTDSPVKTRKADLQAQLYREPRYNRIQTMAQEFRLTLINDSTTSSSSTSTAQDTAAAALLSLFSVDATAV